LIASFIFHQFVEIAEIIVGKNGKFSKKRQRPKDEALSTEEKRSGENQIENCHSTILCQKESFCSEPFEVIQSKEETQEVKNLSRHCTL
jgi:hypothetical protein